MGYICNLMGVGDTEMVGSLGLAGQLLKQGK